MIIDAFKNEISPKAHTGFEDDVDEEEVLKRHCDKINRLPSKKSELPTIKEEKENFTANDLDKMHTGNAYYLDKLLLDAEKYLDPDQIKKYFFNKSLKKYLNF